MSTTSASAPASGTCAANLYDTPVRDIACAMPYSEDNIDLMSKCCKDADIISYYDNCGLYCLALDQSAEELTDCLFEEGAKYEHVFCRDGNDASATATGAEPLESADTTVVKSGEDNESGDDNDDDSDSDGDDEDAAALTRPSHTTVAGVVVGTLLFTATAFGGIMI